MLDCNWFQRGMCVWLARVACLIGITTAGILFPSPLRATIQLQVTSSLTSPQPLGSSITWTASVVDSNPGPVTYLFEVLAPGATTYSILQDFSLSSTFTWTPSVVEGTYQFKILARDLNAGQGTAQVTPFVVNPLVTGNVPVVTPAANPLVALFSAPACASGSSMRVVFNFAGSTSVSRTNLRPCQAGTMNFYIAGMAASQTYQMHYEVVNGSATVVDPHVLSFQTGAIPSAKFPQRTLLVPPTSQSSASVPLLLTSYVTLPTCSPNAFPTVTALNGTVLWFYPYSAVLTRPVPGGTMLVIASGPGTGGGFYGGLTKSNIVREIDLAGNILRQTNADRISELLQSRGADPIVAFHHEALRLSNGNTLVFGSNERVFPSNTQGSAGPINVIGLMVIMLDPNFQPIWYWNSFDHAGGGTQLDINRAAVRGEQCVTGADVCQSQGCPPVLISSPANDWLHANSAQLLPDGNLMFSLRNQDWVIKIDFNNGTGTGNVLWRLGLGGDFTINSTDPYPWFSGQHEATFQNGGSQILSLFDNGNSRVLQFPGQNSRGQVMTVDQVNRVVTMNLNADLGSYSVAFGSGQLLPNGNYLFQSGFINTGLNAYEQATEVTPTGTIVYESQGQAISYRSWRLRDLYSAPAY